MDFFDFLNGIWGAPLPADAAQPVQVIDPATGITPSQQKWMDALSGVSAALRDAGAYLQHQPEAAGNVAGFNNQRQQRLQDAIGLTNYNNLLLSKITMPARAPGQLFPNGLPPAARAWLLQRLQQYGSAAAQNQSPAPQGLGNLTQSAPSVPNSDADTGWSIERSQ